MSQREQPLVLFVDDETLSNVTYVRALKRLGYQVEHLRDPESAFDYVSKHGPAIAAIVLDIMMPPGERYRHTDTDEGLTTGLALYHDLRPLCPKTPIVALTNLNNPDMLTRFPKELPVLYKLDNPPRELADRVGQIIHKPQQNKEGRV